MRTFKSKSEAEPEQRLRQSGVNKELEEYLKTPLCLGGEPVTGEQLEAYNANSLLFWAEPEVEKRFLNLTKVARSVLTSKMTPS